MVYAIIHRKLKLSNTKLTKTWDEPLGHISLIPGLSVFDLSGFVDYKKVHSTRSRKG
jgi:hypothetical protein